MAGGKDNVKRNRLKEPDRTKYALYDIIKMEVGRCGNWNVLIANLKRQGVEVHFKHKGQTSEVQGVVFSMNGYHFNGSKWTGVSVIPRLTRLCSTTDAGNVWE